MDFDRLAAWIRSWTGLDAESSPWAFIDRLHLRAQPLRHVPGRARLAGRCIQWDVACDFETQRRAVAREIARWCLRVVGEDDSDDSASRLAAAISSSYAESEPGTERRLRLLPLVKPRVLGAGRPLLASPGRQTSRAGRRR